MSKLRHKLCNSQNISPWSPNFLNYILPTNFRNNLGHFPTNLRQHYQKMVFSTFLLLFSILSSKMSRNMCKLRHKLWNAKNRVAFRFTWQKLFSQIFFFTIKKKKLKSGIFSEKQLDTLSSFEMFSGQRFMIDAILSWNCHTQLRIQRIKEFLKHSDICYLLLWTVS